MKKQTELNSFFSKVFLWMFVGLALTFGVGFVLSTYLIELFVFLLDLPFFFLGLILFQLGLVFLISFFMKKIPANLALILFLLYSFVSGITFATIFLVFELGSIFFVFGLTSVLFALLAVIGFVTKKDLTNLGVILFVALIGVIIASIINIFLGNSLLDLVISAIAVVVFMGLIAFDTQKLKKIASNALNENELNQFAVFGALNLYLDFVNLFLNLLRLFGDRRR